MAGCAALHVSEKWFLAMATEPPLVEYVDLLQHGLGGWKWERILGRPFGECEFELIELDRLGEKVVHTGLQTAFPVAVEGIGSHGDDGSAEAGHRTRGGEFRA